MGLLRGPDPWVEWVHGPDPPWCQRASCSVVQQQHPAHKATHGSRIVAVLIPVALEPVVINTATAFLPPHFYTEVLQRNK